MALDVHTSNVSCEMSSCLLFICWSYHIKNCCISSSFGRWRWSDFIGQWWTNRSLCGHLWWVVGVCGFLYVPWGSTLWVFLYKSERLTSINNSRAHRAAKTQLSHPCKLVGHMCSLILMPCSQIFMLTIWQIASSPGPFNAGNEPARLGMRLADNLNHWKLVTEPMGKALKWLIQSPRSTYMYQEHNSYEVCVLNRNVR